MVVWLAEDNSSIDITNWHEVCELLLEWDGFPVFDMNATILFSGPHQVPQHLKEWFSLAFIPKEFIRELLAFIDFVVVDCHRDKWNISNLFLVSDVAFDHMVKDEVLWSHCLTRSLSSSLDLVSNHMFLLHDLSQVFFKDHIAKLTWKLIGINEEATTRFKDAGDESDICPLFQTSYEVQVKLIDDMDVLEKYEIDVGLETWNQDNRVGWLRGGLSSFRRTGTCTIKIKIFNVLLVSIKMVRM